jgi:hypothetical protein
MCSPRFNVVREREEARGRHAIAGIGIRAGTWKSSSLPAMPISTMTSVPIKNNAARTPAAL